MNARARLPSPLVAAGIGAVALALVLAGGLAVDRWPFAVDRRLLLALRRPGDPGVPVGPAWLLPAMRDVTALGGGTVLTIVTVAVVGLLIALRRVRVALVTAAAVVSGVGAMELLKHHVDRARPTIVPHLAEVSGLSFPSGHATDSAVTYLTLAALASRAVETRVARRYLGAVAVLLVGAIGCSRVYLGVHWPSDVMAGWSFGTLWALGWWRLSAPARRGAAPRPARP